MGPHLRARNESEDVEQHDDDDDDDDTAQRDASTEFWSMVSTSRAAKRGRLVVSLKEFYFTTYYKCGLEGLVLIFVFHFER